MPFLQKKSFTTLHCSMLKKLKYVHILNILKNVEKCRSTVSLLNFFGLFLTLFDLKTYGIYMAFLSWHIIQFSFYKLWALLKLILKIHIPTKPPQK